MSRPPRTVPPPPNTRTHPCRNVDVHSQVDPTLSRTVLVSTKLDTRIPQFATPNDVDTFLRAPGLQDTNMLGGAPFYT